MEEEETCCLEGGDKMVLGVVDVRELVTEEVEVAEGEAGDEEEEAEEGEEQRFWRLSVVCVQ